jgi:hypothetical protein
MLEHGMTREEFGAGLIRVALLCLLAAVVILFASGALSCASYHSESETVTSNKRDGTTVTKRQKHDAQYVSPKAVGEVAGEVGEKAAGFLGLSLDALTTIGIGGPSVGVLGLILNRVDRSRAVKREAERAKAEQDARDREWYEAQAHTYAAAGVARPAGGIPVPGSSSRLGPAPGTPAP